MEKSRDEINAERFARAKAAKEASATGVNGEPPFHDFEIQVSNPNFMAATDQVDHTVPEPKPSHIVTIKTQHGEFEQNSHVHEPGWHPCHNQGRQVWWQLDEAGYHIHTGNPNEVRVVGDWAVVQNYLDTGNW